MLEQFSHEHRAQRRRRLGPAAVLSVIAHVGAVSALVAAAMWRLDKLPPVDSPITFAGAIGVSTPEEGAPRPKPPTKDRDKVRVVKTPRQPTDRHREAPPPDQSDEPGDGHDQAGEKPGGPSPFEACPPGSDCTPSILQDVEAPACGNGRVESGEECDDGGRAGGDGCSDACRTETVVVGQGAIEARRIAGDPQIAAPDPVRSQMARAQQKQVRADVRICLDREGEVGSVRVLRSTGYPEYDARLTDRMRTWRYRPYQVNGAAVPVCSIVTFLYRLD